MYQTKSAEADGTRLDEMPTEAEEAPAEDTERGGLISLYDVDPALAAKMHLVNQVGLMSRSHLH
jgi:hypothetical protein